MCGIVGYIGSKEAYPVLIKGLHRLEYRGYDSSGVAMISDEGKLNIYKAKGKVAALEHFAESKDRSGTVGIAHTRWATHGEPNDTNAHPHASQSGDLAIVHNGTIENYTVVKKALEQHGYAFRSETDTEVVVQLIDYIRTDTGCMLFEAVREACHQIVGAYAIAVIDRRNPNQIVVARKSSPLQRRSSNTRTAWSISTTTRSPSSTGASRSTSSTWTTRSRRSTSRNSG